MMQIGLSEQSIWRQLLSCILVMGPVILHADDRPLILEDLIEEAKSECRTLDNGDLTVDDGAVERADLTGDHQENWVLNYTNIRCSTAASLFCGTGGCGLSLIVGETATNRLSKGWSLADLGPQRLVLVQVHGANCGGTNLNPCVEALTWDADAGQFFSTLSVETLRRQD